jgi:hypothetical protein
MLDCELDELTKFKRKRFNQAVRRKPDELYGETYKNTLPS